VANEKRPARSSLGERLRVLRDWLMGGSLPDAAAPGLAGDATPRWLGNYEVLHKIGQGGMGVVYAARDERLGRTLAIKTLSGISSETALKRFWREARAAASVNHPNVCPIYELGEQDGLPFIAMELLEGQPLSERMSHGPLAVAEAGDVCLSVLAALAALHERGLVHRDLKPSNVFLTPHGVKLLDFGLALPLEPALTDSLSIDGQLTQEGLIVGTPRYMAPEQVRGEALDGRADVFSVGAILFEMLAGRPAFPGRTPVEVLHATLHEQPPALTGGPAVVAVDRVIRRALAKPIDERFATAAEMADELRAGLRLGAGDAPVVAGALTRVVVLQFRALRPDPETDFLAFSLPDAISTSLSGLDSLVVRSSATAARFAGESPDLKLLASEADVDCVVMGTLLRAGDQLRVTTQLVEAPAGTLIASHQVQSPLGDLFALQDDLTRRLTEALAQPLAGAPAVRDVPGTARAYEFYLRANEVGRRHDQFHLARDLYLHCLEEDPQFALAWARLGRCYRLMAKYLHQDPVQHYGLAEQAFQRALELNPELSVAHKLYAHLEAELGRAPQAMVRLLGRAHAQRNDPELFAGLVHACRYCGLFEASVAAHQEARRLDPHIPTSLPFTQLWMGEDDAFEDEGGTAIDVEPRLLRLVWSGRRSEARAVLARFGQVSFGRQIGRMLTSIQAYVQSEDPPPRSPAGLPRELEGLATSLEPQSDPEALFIFAAWMSHLGERERALLTLTRAVRGGFFAATTLAREPVFEPLRGDPAYAELIRHAEQGRDAAWVAFRDAGGEALLSVAV
jgi:non-specific serine/threonine protein kinase